MDKRFEQLPQLMKDAINILGEIHSTPSALAMPAVLGVANLAVMPHYRVDSIMFGPVPLSLYILCMLPTGMRKTTNYKEISLGIKKFEEAQWDRLKDEPLRHEMDLKVFKKQQARYIKDREDNGMFGSEPVPTPVRPIETANYRLSKATLNGIIDQLKTQPFVGLSSSEAGEFFNSHSFQGGREGISRATEMSAALTTMWDGETIVRQTGMDSTRLRNRAVNMLFFLQEETVRDFLNNPMFSAQGFVHRILISQSEYVASQAMDLSAQGLARLAQQQARLTPFHQRIEQLISERLQLIEDRDFELQPRVLQLTDQARTLAEHFYNTNRNRSRSDLANWAGFGERLYEHMLRIAGTLAAFEQKTAVDATDIAGAMDLMDYFIEQRQQLELGVTSRNQQLTLAVDRLAAWVATHQFTGTRNELRRRVRWFGALSEAEKNEILEDLVRSERLWITASEHNGRATARYSWREEIPA